jgi:hypothetical protein
MISGPRTGQILYKITDNNSMEPMIVQERKDTRSCPFCGCEKIGEYSLRNGKSKQHYFEYDCGTKLKMVLDQTGVNNKYLRGEKCIIP